jgi:hypothetical protein
MGKLHFRKLALAIIFLNISSIADFKRFCTAKETINRAKRQPFRMGEIFENDTSGRV